jgi:hypothetical protein
VGETSTGVERDSATGLEATSTGTPVSIVFAWQALRKDPHRMKKHTINRKDISWIFIVRTICLFEKFPRSS